LFEKKNTFWYYDGKDHQNGAKAEPRKVKTTQQKQGGDYS
jgi:hypothetical protein